MRDRIELLLPVGADTHVLGTWVTHLTQFQYAVHLLSRQIQISIIVRQQKRIGSRIHGGEVHREKAMWKRPAITAPVPLASDEFPDLS